MSDLPALTGREKPSDVRAVMQAMPLSDRRMVREYASERLTATLRRIEKLAGLLGEKEVATALAANKLLLELALPLSGGTMPRDDVRDLLLSVGRLLEEALDEPTFDALVPRLNALAKSFGL